MIPPSGAESHRRPAPTLEQRWAVLYWPGTVVSPCGATWAVKGPHRMAIDAYILPFPDGVMGFVDADPARLRLRGGRVTLALYGPAEATAADQAALRARFIEALGSSIRSEGGYAALFWPHLWWTVGGLLSLVFLILVALPSGLSLVWPHLPGRNAGATGWRGTARAWLAGTPVTAAIAPPARCRGRAGTQPRHRRSDGGAVDRRRSSARLGHGRA